MKMYWPETESRKEDTVCWYLANEGELRKPVIRPDRHMNLHLLIHLTGNDPVVEAGLWERQINYNNVWKPRLVTSSKPKVHI